MSEESIMNTEALESMRVELLRLRDVVCQADADSIDEVLSLYAPPTAPEAKAGDGVGSPRSSEPGGAASLLPPSGIDRTHSPANVANDADGGTSIPNASGSVGAQSGRQEKTEDRIAAGDGNHPPAFRRVCSWCGCDLPGSNPTVELTSHGICQPCKETLTT